MSFLFLDYLSEKQSLTSATYELVGRVLRTHTPRLSYVPYKNNLSECIYYVFDFIDVMLKWSKRMLFKSPL